MNKTILVFTVIMIQTILSIAWYKLGIEPFKIWIYGCIIADVAAVVAYIFLDMDIRL